MTKLTIDNVSKQYGAKTAIDSLAMELTPGVIGLLGPNGAGKSTLMRMLTTVEQPTNGNIYWNGHNIVKQPDVVRRVLGYLPQEFGVYHNLNPVEFLHYMAAMKGLNRREAKQRIHPLLEALNLSDVRKRAIGSFSGGMKQRVGIAQALLNDPSLLIVDEPTVGLDPEERIRFRNLLSSLSKDVIVILSTHIVSDIESIASQIVLMSKGTLLMNTSPEALLKQVDKKVWQWKMDSAHFSQVQQQFMVSSFVHRSDGIYARIVSDTAPSIDAELIPASMEDAYLYYVSSSQEGRRDA
ncbi:ABC transporter ATP-binding protein [Longirhabdus pacifica]|uniref:ABC transporter ATP-binding protein n=1 Tax=Longirhabdus pacifica TaxID=2305227 RepID=UPI00100905AE|nr:ABC transporter ATP-binding protein [Longirhabdus pacifica]